MKSYEQKPVELSYHDCVMDTILFWYDGPVIYTVTWNGKQYLCLMIDEVEGRSVSLMVPTSDSTIESLLNGGITMRAAMLQHYGYVVELDDGIKQAWLVNPQTLGDEYLPEVDAKLTELL